MAMSKYYQDRALAEHESKNQGGGGGDTSHIPTELAYNESGELVLRHDGVELEDSGVPNQLVLSGNDFLSISYLDDVIKNPANKDAITAFIGEDNYTALTSNSNISYSIFKNYFDAYLSKIIFIETEVNEKSFVFGGEDKANERIAYISASTDSFRLFSIENDGVYTYYISTALYQEGLPSFSPFTSTDGITYTSTTPSNPSFIRVGVDINLRILTIQNTLLESVADYPVEKLETFTDETNIPIFVDYQYINNEYNASYFKGHTKSWEITIEPETTPSSTTFNYRIVLKKINE